MELFQATLRLAIRLLTSATLSVSLRPRDPAANLLAGGEEILFIFRIPSKSPA